MPLLVCLISFYGFFVYKFSFSVSGLRLSDFPTKGQSSCRS